MPRRAKPGGMRVGAPGTAYGNRTDLNTQKDLPARAATGQTYGLAGQQLQAQQTVPMAPQPVPMPPPGAPAPAPAAAPTTPGALSPPAQSTFAPPTAPPPMVPPGSMGPLARPSEFPNEPVTSGIAMGAGPGPESLAPSPLTASSGIGSLSAMLTAAAQSSGSATLADLARRAQAAGQ